VENKLKRDLIGTNRIYMANHHTPIIIKLLIWIMTIISLAGLTSCVNPNGLRTIKTPRPQQPLIKAYTAIYKNQNIHKPVEINTEKYVSDGKGHLYIDSGLNSLLLYDCKLKRRYIVSKNKGVYTFYDKTVDPHNIFCLSEIVDEGGLQNEVPSINGVESINELFKARPAGMTYVSSPSPKDFLGIEIIDSYSCNHYKNSISTNAQSELWYSQELNCCVKHISSIFGNSYITTLISYSQKIDPKVFDLSPYRYVPPIEFKKESGSHP